MRNLTERERQVLKEELNLADGHAYRCWSEGEAQVVARVSELFTTSDRRQRSAREDEYFDAFFRLGGQTRPSGCDPLLCHSASEAIEIVANHLRLRKMGVQLIEPSFDNLADILKRHGIRLEPMSDAALVEGGEALERLLEQSDAGALFLVVPNNPSGAMPDEGTFRQIVDHCRRRGRLLILDTCFRFYVPGHRVYDQYSILAASGVNHVVIEDTGKTWPSQELKAPFMAVSGGVARPLQKIHSDFLLHVSPFAVRLLTEFVREATTDGRRHLQALVAARRARLADLPRSVRLVDSGFMPVAWLRIEDGRSDVALVDAAAAAGVHVLPGGQFFWDDPERGRDHVRLSLVRDEPLFDVAIDRLGEVW